ncbi:hypothetical protein LXL04_011796 [Taraxacum kok-saghyz]
MRYASVNIPSSPSKWPHRLREEPGNTKLSSIINRWLLLMDFVIHSRRQPQALTPHSTIPNRHHLPLRHLQFQPIPTITEYRRSRTFFAISIGFLLAFYKHFAMNESFNRPVPDEVKLLDWKASNKPDLIELLNRESCKYVDELLPYPDETDILPNAIARQMMKAVNLITWKAYLGERKFEFTSTRKKLFNYRMNRYSTHELHKPKAVAESASEPDLPKRTPVAGARVHFRHWYLIVISANSLKLYCISFVSSISTTSGVCFHHLSHCCSSAGRSARIHTENSEMMKSENLFESQGGPIILSQIENEYGAQRKSYGATGKAYINWEEKMAAELNKGVPWLMCEEVDAPDPVVGLRNLQYHGGTNFGRTSGGPFITTSYDYDAPVDEYGLIREPKYGHLTELHRAIKLCEPAFFSSDAIYIPLGQRQQSMVGGRVWVNGQSIGRYCTKHAKG